MDHQPHPTPHLTSDLPGCFLGNLFVEMRGDPEGGGGLCVWYSVQISRLVKLHEYKSELAMNAPHSSWVLHLSSTLFLVSLSPMPDRWIRQQTFVWSSERIPEQDNKYSGYKKSTDTCENARGRSIRQDLNFTIRLFLKHSVFLGWSLWEWHLAFGNICPHSTDFEIVVTTQLVLAASAVMLLWSLSFLLEVE